MGKLDVLSKPCLIFLRRACLFFVVLGQKWAHWVQRDNYERQNNWVYSALKSSQAMLTEGWINVGFMMLVNSQTIKNWGWNFTKTNKILICNKIKQTFLKILQNQIRLLT